MTDRSIPSTDIDVRFIEPVAPNRTGTTSRGSRRWSKFASSFPKQRTWTVVASSHEANSHRVAAAERTDFDYCDPGARVRYPQRWNLLLVDRRGLPRQRRHPAPRRELHVRSPDRLLARSARPRHRTKRTWVAIAHPLDMENDENHRSSQVNRRNAPLPRQ
jgi:hypothetical protein